MSENPGTNVEATDPLHVRIAWLSEMLVGEYPPHVLEDLRMASAQLQAFAALYQAVCGETGFANAVRLDSGLAYPWPALDDAEALADASFQRESGSTGFAAPIRHIVIGRGEWVAGTYLQGGLPSLCFGPAPEAKAPGEAPTEEVAQFATRNGAVVISLEGAAAATRLLDMIKEAMDLMADDLRGVVA